MAKKSFTANNVAFDAIAATSLAIATANVSGTLNVGANVNLDTSGLKVGNSIANVVINSTYVDVNNVTHDVIVSPGVITVSGVNNLLQTSLTSGVITQYFNSEVSDNNPTLLVFRKTRGGANVAENDFIQIAYWQGVDTEGTTRDYGFTGLRARTANSTFITGEYIIGLANSTGGTSYLFMCDNASVVFPRDIIIGGTNINATSIDVGANVVLNTTTLRVGNTTANAHVNSTGFFLNGSAIGSQGMTATVFTANGTWTKPAGCKRIEVLVVGGGGGGGASGSSNTVGGGGGGGGGGVIHFANAEALTTVAVVAGLGGAGGVGSAGSTGGTSSFGALASATGGAGGGLGTVNLTGGAGGVGSAGSVQINGQGGDGGNAQAGINGSSGSGGSSFLGAGSVGKSGVPSQDGVAGGSYGGGGSGGWSWNTSANGGAGARGIVIVKEYY